METKQLTDKTLERRIQTLGSMITMLEAELIESVCELENRTDGQLEIPEFGESFQLEIDYRPFKVGLSE